MSVTLSEPESAEDRVCSGQTWRCDESAAEDLPEPWDRPYQAAGIAEYARFRVAVVAVLDGVAELSVTIGNGHPRTPEPGGTLDVAVETLASGPRWAEVTNDDDE